MIEITNLTKFYDTTCALDNISFKVKKGEILGLLGPNGAGKTTTIRILTCYLPPTKGTIKVKDFDIRQEPIEVKKLIGYFPETAPLYMDMLVYEYLDYIAEMRSLNKDQKAEQITELAALCGITDVMHKSIGQLSKGYKQRVGLAHAMIGDPEILVLDEPTSGLDPNQIIEIRNLIKKIGKKKTIILSSHILPEVEATCDRVVIINQGKIVANDKTENLKKKAHKEYTINLNLLNAEFNKVEALLSGMEHLKSIKPGDKQDDSLAIEITADEDIRTSIFNKIKQTDWAVQGMNLKTKSLENIFLELTKEKEDA